MDDYDLLPHDEIKRMKQEIDSLKRNAQTSGAGSSEPLIESMENMTRSINMLLKIFKEAGEDMKLDEHDSVLLSDKIDPLIQKIDRVLEQNEKIAKGIVAIADMIDDLKSPGAEVPRPVYPRKNVYGAQASMPPEEEPSPPPQPTYTTSFESNMQPISQPRPLPMAPASSQAPQDLEKKQSLFNIRFK